MLCGTAVLSTRVRQELVGRVGGKADVGAWLWAIEAYKKEGLQLPLTGFPLFKPRESRAILRQPCRKPRYLWQSRAIYGSAVTFVPAQYTCSSTASTSAVARPSTQYWTRSPYNQVLFCTDWCRGLVVHFGPHCSIFPGTWWSRAWSRADHVAICASANPLQVPNATRPRASVCWYPPLVCWYPTTRVLRYVRY